MSETELKIESLTVRRAPGFPAGGFTVDDLSSGVNVVHGPNGSGKTTLARSIQDVLWPQESDQRSSILGHFSVGDQQWNVDLASGRARYQRNGVEANGPSLPSAEQRHRYHLSLHDLLQNETQNQPFAARIQQESIGGYDLDAAYQALNLDSSPSSRGIGEYKTAQKAREAWQKAKQDAEKLESEESRLPVLKSRLEEANAAKRQVDLYSQAIEYRQAQNELEEAEDALEEFPAKVAELTGDEADTVRNLNERIAAEQDTIEEAETALDQAREDIDEAALPTEGLPDGFIEELEERRDILESLETRNQQLESELQNALTRREEALADIPLDVEQETLEAFDPAAWEDIESFVEAAAEVRANRNAYTAVESWLGTEESSTHEIKQLQRGSQVLEEWLAAGTLEGDQAAPLWRVVAVSAGLLGGAGLALGLLVHPALLATVIVALVVLLYGYRVKSGAGTTSGNPRRPHRETYGHLELDDPESWSQDAVRAQLNEIYAAIADAQLEQQRAERRSALTGDLDDLAAREQELEEQRDQLLEQYDVAPDTTDTELLVITRRVLDWQAVNSEVEGRRAEIASVRESITETCDQLESALEPYGYTSITDHAEARKHIRNLDRRHQNYREATAAIENAEATIEASKETIAELTDRRAVLFSKLKLEDEARSELDALCEQVDAYQAAKTAVNGKQEVRDKEARDLKQHPAFSEDVLERPMQELYDAKEQASDTAANREELRTSITQIETRVEDAKSDYDLEGAVETRQRALDALEDRLDADASAMVGDALVDYLRSAADERGRPEVFEHAREIFAKITRGRYRLDIDGDAFRAYDTVTQQGFTLEALSSGTRLQMLLAVRIAFVEQQEHGTKIPLLLDETLANSDDYRADVIIQSMIELARDGRQVFYFTAQGDEVAKWQRALATTEGVDHSTIDLASIRGTGQQLAVPSLEEIADTIQNLPDPAGFDHEGYGDALDVPPFSPLDGAGTAHIWYLVDDPEVVYKLLRLGIEQWGQLESLLEQTDGSVISEDEGELHRIQRTGTALNEFVKSWEVGRGKRVDRQTLEKASAVSETFIDELHQLTERVDGDAEVIIRRLRAGDVNRFRSGKMDELEEYFESQGYIQQREPLASETIRARVVSRLSRTGLTDDDAFDRVHALFKRLVARSSEQPATQPGVEGES